MAVFILDTYKELEVKKQNPLFLNFLLRGHPAEIYKPVLILCLTDYPSEQLCLFLLIICLYSIFSEDITNLTVSFGNRINNVATHLWGTYSE